LLLLKQSDVLPCNLELIVPSKCFKHRLCGKFVQIDNPFVPAGLLMFISLKLTTIHSQRCFTFLVCFTMIFFFFKPQFLVGTKEKKQISSEFFLPCVYRSEPLVLGSFGGRGLNDAVVKDFLFIPILL